NEYTLLVLMCPAPARCRRRRTLKLLPHRPLRDLPLELGDGFGHFHRPQVTGDAVADGDAAALHLFAADYEHVGDQLELRVADLAADLFWAVVAGHSQAG